MLETFTGHIAPYMFYIIFVIYGTATSFVVTIKGTDSTKYRDA